MIPVSVHHTKIATLVRLAREALAGRHTLEPKLLENINQTLVDHQIELIAMPSPCPGTPRQGSQGAGPKQANVVKAFRYGRHVPIPNPPTDDVARRLLEIGEPKFNRIFAGGANRSGKTVGLWGMCFCPHLRDHAKPKEIYWCIAPNFTKLRQGPHKWLWTYLPRAMFGQRVYTESLGFGVNPIIELHLPAGGTCSVVFKTEEQSLESYESDSVSGIAWTEATRESIYDACISRLVDTSGFMLIDYLRDEAWHGDRLEANAYAYYQHFCMSDNAHNLPPGEIERARRDMTPEQAAVRIDGKNRAAYGVVIKEFRNEAYRRGDPDSGQLVRPFIVPKNWPKWIYTDVGKYTASLLLTVGPDGRKFVVDEVYTVGEMYDEHARHIDAMLLRNALAREDIAGGRDGGSPWSMDPAAWNYSPTNQRNLGDLWRSTGLPYNPWVLTATIGERMMLENLRLEFTQFGLLIFDRCRHLIDELMSWKHKLDRDGKIDPKEAYTGNNHAIDALKAWNASKPGYASRDSIEQMYRNMLTGEDDLWPAPAKDAPPSLSVEPLDDSLPAFGGLPSPGV